MTSRPELVQSAVLFLKDPKAQSAPIQQQNEFLASKGLTPEEIVEARNLVAGSVAMPPLPPRPSPPKRTWKDFFIGVIGMGAVLIGAVHATSYFLTPFVDFPTAKEIEKDTNIIKSELENTSKLIAKIADQTNTLSKGVETQNASVSSSLGEMEVLLAHIGEEDNKRRIELLKIKDDVDKLKDMLPQVIEKEKEARLQIIQEIQTEIKSLKGILLNARFQGSPAMAVLSEGNEQFSVAGINLKKTGIPAWQLKPSDSAKDGSNTVNTIDSQPNTE